MRPFTPLKSPPALPMKTRPFQAIGAAGAGLEVIGQHLSVRGTAIEMTVQIGSAAIAVENRVCVVLVRSPILSTSDRIDRKDVMFRGTDQRAVHYDWAGREAPSLLGVVGAQHPES